MKSLAAAFALATLTVSVPAAAQVAQKDLVLVGATEGRYDAQTTGKGYSALKTADLHVGVLLSDAHRPTGGPTDKSLGLDQLELRYYTPKGFLYMTQLVPIAAYGSGEKERKGEGYAFGLTVREARPYRYTDGKSYGNVDIALPVGGTAISTYSLFGTWRVEVWQAGSQIASRTIDIAQ